MASNKDVSRRGAQFFVEGQSRCFRYKCKVSVCAIVFIVLYFVVCEVQFVNGLSWYTPTTTPRPPSKCPNEPKTMEKVNRVIKDCQDEIKMKIIKEAITYVRQQQLETEEHHIHFHNHRPLKHPNDYHETGYSLQRPVRVKPSHNDYQEIYYYDPHERRMKANVGHHNTVQFIHPFKHLSKPNESNQDIRSWGNKPAPPSLYTQARFLDPRLAPNSQNGLQEVFRQIHAENQHKLEQALLHIRKKRDTEWFHPNILPKEDKRIAGCLMHCIFSKNNAINVYGWPTVDGLVALFTDGVNDRNYFIAVLRGVDWCLNGAFYKYNIDHYHLPSKGESCDVSYDVFDCVSDKITDYCSVNRNANRTMMTTTTMRPK